MFYCGSSCELQRWSFILLRCCPLPLACMALSVVAADCLFHSINVSQRSNRLPNIFPSPCAMPPTCPCMRESFLLPSHLVFQSQKPTIDMFAPCDITSISATTSISSEYLLPPLSDFDDSERSTTDDPIQSNDVLIPHERPKELDRFEKS